MQKKLHPEKSILGFHYVTFNNLHGRFSWAASVSLPREIPINLGWSDVTPLTNHDGPGGWRILIGHPYVERADKNCSDCSLPHGVTQAEFQG